MDLTENPAISKDSLSRQVKMSRRKEVEKGKQQLKSLQRIRNLDDKWHWHVDILFSLIESK